MYQNVLSKGESLKDGDFIRIDYVGKISESGQIFDLTKEDVARKNGIFNPDFKYGPVPVIIGANMLVKGLEKELKRMKVGEKKKIKVKPEDGFGKRNEKLIKLIPLSYFKKQKITPYPGLLININGIIGRVLSISGGRVRVDFNHPLAGKTLEYEVEIKERITDKKEKIYAILRLFFKETEDFSVRISKEVIEIKMKRDVPRGSKEKIADMLKKWIKDVKKIRFVEEY